MSFDQDVWGLKRERIEPGREYRLGVYFTMPSSPKTPRHSRHPSNIDLSFASPQSYNESPRRHSKTSIHTPTTPNRNSLQRSDSIGIDVFSSGGLAPPSNGLGNLADELADAWGDEEGSGEEDEYGEPEMNFQEVKEEGDGGQTRDSGVDVSSSPVEGSLKPSGLFPPGGVRGHRRRTSEYDGSDYGGDSDLESAGMPLGLVSRMDMVESLVRRGMENTGTDRDGVVKRVIEGLKDLGGQSGVEGGATRYISPLSFYIPFLMIIQTHNCTLGALNTLDASIPAPAIPRIRRAFSCSSTTR